MKKRWIKKYLPEKYESLYLRGKQFPKVFLFEI